MAIENFVDPFTGARIRRQWLGGVAAGRLVLRANATPGIEVLWLADREDLDNTRILFGTLRRCSHPRKIGKRLFMLATLPQGRYWLNHDGSEIFRLLEPLPMLESTPTLPPWHGAEVKIAASFPATLLRRPT